MIIARRNSIVVMILLFLPLPTHVYWQLLSNLRNHAVWSDDLERDSNFCCFCCPPGHRTSIYEGSLHGTDVPVLHVRYPAAKVGYVGQQTTT